MSEKKNEPEVWSHRMIPITLLSDERVVLPTRVMLVIATYGNKEDNNWCPLGVRSIAALSGVIPDGGWKSISKQEVHACLTRVRQALSSLTKSGLLQVRKIETQGMDKPQYRLMVGKPNETCLYEMNKIGKSHGVTYEAVSSEPDWEGL